MGQSSKIFAKLFKYAGAFGITITTSVSSLSLMDFLLSNTDTEQHSKSDQNRFWSLYIIFP